MADSFIPPVQSLPAGLLGFLGIKNGGANPNVLSATLVPTLDLFRLYMLSQIQTKTGTIVIPGGAGTRVASTTLVVPSGKLWYLWEGQISVGSLGIAPPIDIAAFSVDAQFNTTWVRSINPQYGRPVANQTYSVSLSDLWMRQGDALAIADTGTALTGFLVAATLNVVEIQV